MPADGGSGKRPSFRLFLGFCRAFWSEWAGKAWHRRVKRRMADFILFEIDCYKVHLYAYLNLTGCIAEHTVRKVVFYLGFFS